MDYRLDLFNAINNYIDNKTEEDSILVLTFNSSDGDLIVGSEGDTDLLSSVMANENNAINFIKDDSLERYDHCRRTILNIAFNILRVNTEFRDTFQNGLNNLPK